jgi:hypothetical protein
MTSTIVSSLELACDLTEAAQAASKGPVFVTERGDMAYVILNFTDYQRLIREHRNMAELLSVPDIAADVDFDPPRSTEPSPAADFS